MPTVVNKAMVAPLFARTDKSLADNVFAITPSDTVLQPVPIDEIYVGGVGNVTIKGLNGIAVTYNAVPVGSRIRVSGAVYVMATGTTATLLTGIADQTLRA